MKRIMLHVSLVAIAALLSSCTSAGTSFDHGNLPRLTLQKTARQEVITLIGEPRETNRTINDDGDFEILEYLYGKGGLSVAKVRLLDIELKDGVLNGYTYVSTFPEDAASFDFSAFESLEIGSSSREDVLRVLGKPTGQALCPSNLMECGREGPSEVWVWHSMFSVSRDELHSKSVIISFDVDGVVSDIAASNEVR